MLKVFGLAFLRSLWQMCASKPFSVTSSSISSSSCDLRLQLRLRGCRSVLRVTFVGHFVQSAAPPSPLCISLLLCVKSLKTSAFPSVVSFSFWRRSEHGFYICSFVYMTAAPAPATAPAGRGQQGSLVQRLPLKLSDCKSVTHSPSFLNTHKQIFIYLRL